MALLNLVASKVQGPALEPFRQAWSRYDRDNSGVLDIGEFKALINELGSLPNGVSVSDVRETLIRGEGVGRGVCVYCWKPVLGCIETDVCS